MPYSLRALLSVMLLIGSCQCALAESSSWWPFGKKEEPPITAAAPTTTAPAFTPSPGLPPSSAITPVGPELPTPQVAIPQSAAPQAALSNYPPASLPRAAPPVVAKDSDRPPLLESPIEVFKWPGKKMHEWTQSKEAAEPPSSHVAQQERPRNSWVEKTPEPPKPSPMQSVRNGAHYVAESTRSAWRKTVGAAQPGGADDQRTGSRIASRDIKPPFWQRMWGTEDKPKDDQTVAGFVGQPRP